MPRGSQRDFNQTLMQMVISQHLQSKAEQRRAEQSLQQSIVQQQLKQQSELDKERRKFSQDVLLKHLDAQQKRAQAGELPDTAGLPPEAGELLLRTALGAQQTQATDALAQAALSGDQGALQSAQAGAKAAGLPAPTEPGFGDVNLDVVRRIGSMRGQEVAKGRELSQQQRIQSEASIEQESRSNTLKGFAQGGAERLAGYRLGLEGFGPVTPQQLVDEASALFPNESPDKRRRAVIDAFNRSNKIVGDELRKQRSSEGMTSEQIRREAFAKYAERKASPDAATAVENPLDLWSREEAGELMGTGNLLEDPMTGAFEMFTAPTQGKKWQEGRLALAELVRLQREVEMAFLEASETTPWYKAGPLTGAQPVQDFLQLFGEQSPAATAYSVLSFRMVSTILKATQGSRPSDFDLRMYMAMLPSLTELGSESGERKLEVMRNMLSMAANAPFDPEVAKRVREMRNKEWTSDDLRAANAFRAYERALQSGDPAKIRAAQRRLNVTHDEWSKRRGTEFLAVPNAGSQAPAGVQSAVSDIVGGAP